MNVLSKPRFDEAAEQHPTDRAGLERVYALLRKANPASYQDLQSIFGTNIDLFKHRAAANWVVIDIGGNNLRLIGAVDYKRQTFFTKHIMTHSEYTKANDWYKRSSNTGTKP